jgi:protein ImuB
LWRPGEHGGDGATAERPAFIEQLRARLGDAAVTGIALAEGHRPERLSVASLPALGAAPAATAAASVPWPAGRRPLWLLSSPSPLEEQAGWPVREGHRLDLLGGPERVETGWWDGEEVQRDYYQAVDGRGSRLWIFRERLLPHRWFLHGVFS